MCHRLPLFGWRGEVSCGKIAVMVLVESERLSQGWEAVDFKLEGVDGKEYSLDSFSDKKGLLIIFTCNHCPYAKAAWPITIGLANQYEEGVSFVAVNPNSANKEYPDDSLEEMKKKAKKSSLFLLLQLN